MNLVYHLEDIWILAQTIYGEARGERLEGQKAVACVVMNRYKDKRWPATIARVCKQPWQFSCWNKADPNSVLLAHLDLTDETFRKCYAVAAFCLAEIEPDKTRGANHYHTMAVTPKWSDRSKQTALIGSHIFYKL